MEAKLSNDRADAAAQQKRREHQQRQRAELRDRRDAGEQRAELHADDVGDAGEDDGAGSEIVGPVADARAGSMPTTRRKYSPNTDEMPPSAAARIRTSCAHP